MSAASVEPGAKLLIFEQLDSTNEEARRCAARGEVTPVYLMARTQTAGRGRRGREWMSLPGNLFLTYLGATKKTPAEIALLGFAAGVALAEFCDSVLAAGRARLKWPNDLMLDGRKAAGLLLESGALADGRNWFAIGVGFNLLAAPEGVGQETAALADLAPRAVLAPETVANDFAERLSSWAARLDREGFAPLRAAWETRAYGLGDAASVDLGSATLAGISRGLSPRGELMLELPNGEMRAVAAGDILFPHLAPA
jgi:BirA family transcriptional regulator, biotin operon repressor / biotin---[acetyl-CoA-carboxylase] ligase